MEDEFDLRVYIEVLLRHWWWIAVLALALALIGFVVSSLLPGTYEASAVVLATQPRYQLQFDPRFETLEDWNPAYKAFPALAMSDAILQAVVDVYDPTPLAGIDEWRLGTLSEMAGASSGGDPSLVLLQVRSHSAQDAAAIANAWADILVYKGNQLFGETEEDVAFFEEQTAQAAQALYAADAALIEFEARNESRIVEAQLSSQRQTQADYLTDQRAISYLLQDLQGLRTQLAAQPGDQAVSLADSLTALFLQIKAFNVEASVPIQLQLDISQPPSAQNLSEQIAFLDDLVATLESRSVEIDTRLSTLQPTMLTLQQRLQEINVEQDRLTRAQQLARETYLTLARKRDEARIAAQEEQGMLQVGSHAAVPERPVAPRRLYITGIAGILGLVAGAVGAVFVEFWRQTGSNV